MRILHLITNTELGGAQKVCIELCNAAVRDGNQVAVASMAGGWLWQSLDSRVEQIYIPGLIKPIRPLPDIKALVNIKKALAQFKPDVLQLHSSKAGTLGRIAALGTGIKVVYTVHGFDSIRVVHRKFLFLERMMQHWCSAIVGVSQYDVNNLKSERICSNLSCIYNGIEDPADRTDDRLDSLKDRKIVMTIARIAPPKKLDQFFEVASAFDDSYAFVWIGGSDKYSLDEIHQMYKVPGNVYLLGNVPQASELMHYADVFVLLSDYEGLPMSIIEAMSKGKSVVASAVGGIPELIQRENGRLVTDTQSVIDGINDMIGADCSCNRNKYENLFTVDKMWKDYCKLYNSL